MGRDLGTPVLHHHVNECVSICYSDDKIQVPADHLCLLEALVQGEYGDSDDAVKFAVVTTVSEGGHSTLTRLDNSSDFYRISCALKSDIRKVAGDDSVSYTTSNCCFSGYELRVYTDSLYTCTYYLNVDNLFAYDLYAYDLYTYGLNADDLRTKK